MNNKCILVLNLLIVLPMWGVRSFLHDTCIPQNEGEQRGAIKAVVGISVSALTFFLIDTFLKNNPRDPNHHKNYELKIDYCDGYYTFRRERR